MKHYYLSNFFIYFSNFFIYSSNFYFSNFSTHLSNFFKGGGVHAQYASRKNFFFSKLADFWYTGVFGHEKSIGASSEFQKNFFDPLWGYPMLKNQFFNIFILAP